MSVATLIRPNKIAKGFAVPFNWRAVGDRVLVTNMLGDWLVLEPDEVRRLAEGDTEPGDGLYERLAERNFVTAELDVRYPDNAPHEGKLFVSWTWRPEARTARPPRRPSRRRRSVASSRRLRLWG